MTEGAAPDLYRLTWRANFVLGVSIIVAVIGTPATYPAAHTAFVHGWWGTLAPSSPPP